MEFAASPESIVQSFRPDERGFTGAEKALLGCFALAIIALTGALLQRGSEQAAGDARRTLSGEGQAAGNWQKAISPIQAGLFAQPGGTGTTGRVRAIGLGLEGRPGSRDDDDGPGNLRSQAPADAQLQYYGGPVVSNAKVYAVYWENGNNQVDQGLKDQLPGFYKAVVDSPYIDWLSEYDSTGKAVGGQNGTGQHIGRGTYGGAITIHPDTARAGNSITNQDIQDEINHQIDLGNLPPPDANTIYMIHFPKQVSIDLDGSKSCQEFCAYHNTLSRNGQNVYYGVMPDVGPGTACANGCGSSANSFDNQTSVSSHELIETITDPAVGLATGNGPPLGWYDQKNGEIGDICNAEQGTLPGTSYTVQKEWSNTAGACIVSRNDTSGAVSTNIVPPRPNQPRK